MKSVIIVGAGGFGREVLEIFKDNNKESNTWDILGFIDDNRELEDKLINGYPVLGGLDWLKKHGVDRYGCVCAVGTSGKRKEIVQRLEQIGIDFVNAIHSSVIISDSVQLGCGVIICAGSILTVNIKIGNHVHINLNSTIGHDAVIEPFCTISPAVSINGHNRLGEGVFVGTGAVFNQEVSVGDWTTIGAGAVVVRDIPDRVVAVGIPAKPIKKI